MGKNKKTRWRTFSFDGSKDETQINGVDVKVNDTDLNSTVNSQKYSQILGDHQTNYLPHNKSSNSISTAHHNSFKARSYNNKENYYNQRSGVVKNSSASKNSWQRNSSAFRATALSLKDSTSGGKPEENGTSDSDKQSSPSINAEPIKFNEDEYTRITTPRQDVLFKKGYLSRMNSNKTANTNTSTVDSTGPNSTVTTATNSDPESSLSVSTLSPATTPSMDYGQMDPQDFNSAPMYYPGYYDDSGMLVFPMYNGYNYYPPNGSTSPVYLMPYPYQYDPFFMAPNTEVSVSDSAENQQQEEEELQQNGEAEKVEKEDSDAEKENNQIAGEENNVGDEKKDVKQEQTEEAPSNEINEQTPKQCFPIYANDMSYVNPYGFYNGPFYYYNGLPVSSASRPPKGKRRKRYSSSRSSQSYPPPPRSTAETTTDYSDDDGGNSTHNRRYYTRYNHTNHHHNGWNYHNGHNHHNHHSNGYNQYHYNSKYHHKNYVDQNANQAPVAADAVEREPTHHESNLNADVIEFYPRVHSNSSSQQQHQKEQESKNGVPVNDLEKSQQHQNATNKSKSDALAKKTAASAATATTKPSHTSKSVNRGNNKKEIMDGIKLMEQQNINLKATSKAQMMKVTANSLDADIEWNVIKNGKKVKVVKDSQNSDASVEQPAIEATKKDLSKGVNQITQYESTTLKEEPVSNKKSTSSTSSTGSQVKPKKFKSKTNKKKKLFSMTKQDGFEIIEPDFSSNVEKESEEITNEASEEDEATIVEEQEASPENIINDNNAIECDQKEKSNEPDQVNVNVDKQLFVDDELKTKQQEEEETLKVAKEKEEDKQLSSDENKVHEEILRVFNVEQKLIAVAAVNDEDAIIDISDEEICRKTSIEIDLSIAQEIAKIECEPIVEQKFIKKQQKAIAVAPIAIVEATETEEQIFEDSNYFNDRKNIVELERDLLENLKSLDDGIDLKSPVINPLYDFPITSAVRKWLQEKQNESFDNLFRVENFKKLSELYDDCDEDDDDGESDISDSPQKTETTDSDYASDIQVKLNGSPASSNAKLDTKLSSKCNNKLIVKESFCALM